jgi:hypothetical protein
VFLSSIFQHLSLSLCIPRSAFLSYSAVSTDLQKAKRPKQQQQQQKDEQ